MKKQLMVATLTSSMVLAGCASTGSTGAANGTQDINKGVLGALAGAAAGAIISKSTGGEHTGRDAAIGALLGGGIGLYMENQARQLEEQMAGTGVDVELDPYTNDINLVMPSNITFDTNSTYVKPSFTNTLNKLANTMQEYDRTTVVIMGHTDSDGSADYNQRLSEGRASSVKSYLYNRGVAPVRMTTIGYGESMPIASNATAMGKADNRRVEIKINAPDQL